MIYIIIGIFLAVLGIWTGASSDYFRHFLCGLCSTCLGAFIAFFGIIITINPATTYYLRRILLRIFQFLYKQLHPYYFLLSVNFIQIFILLLWLLLAFLFLERIITFLKSRHRVSSTPITCKPPRGSPSKAIFAWFTSRSSKKQNVLTSRLKSA